MDSEEQAERTDDVYEAPSLGVRASLEIVTLFSGTINTDAGVIDFGDG